METLARVAASALLGWYLMVAPPDARRTCGGSGPLADWQVSSSYDSAAACEAARDKWTKRDLKLKLPPGWTITGEDAACIATDDPRLAK
jgi:hypothetical protein